MYAYYLIIRTASAPAARHARAGRRPAGGLSADPGRSVIPSRGPFDLLFADSGVRDPADFAVLVSVLRIGGRIVMDDVTPERVLPPDPPLRADDIKRGFFTSESRLTWTEIVLPDLRNSLLAGTRTN
jgi:predicted O-methyltransferase YrrM